jgi:hypothetical protein
VRKIKRVITGLLVFALAAGALYAALPALLNLAFKNDSSSTQETKRESAEIQTSQNAYPLLADVRPDSLVVPSSHFLSDYVKNPSLWNTTLVGEALQDNAELIETFNNAAFRLAFVPLDPHFGLDPNSLSTIKGIEQTAQLAAIRALQLARTSQPTEAITQTRALLQLSQKISTNPTSLAVMELGNALYKLGLDTTIYVIPQVSLSGDQYAQLLSDLENMPRAQDVFAAALTAQESQAQSVLSDIATGKLEWPKQEQQNGLIRKVSNLLVLNPTTQNAYYFKPNKTHALLTSYSSKVSAALAGGCSVNTIPSVSQGTLPLPDRITPNLLGERYVAEISAGFSASWDKQCRLEALRGLSIALIGMRSYVLTERAYPSSLADLSPSYLIELPTDPFTGKPLKYDRLRKVIYSLGPEKKDVKGSDGTDIFSMPNPTVRIRF